MKSVRTENVPLGDVESPPVNPSYKGRLYWLTHAGRAKDEKLCSSEGPGRRCGSDAYADLRGSNCDGCNNWEEVPKG